MSDAIRFVYAKIVRTFSITMPSLVGLSLKNAYFGQNCGFRRFFALHGRHYIPIKLKFGTELDIGYRVFTIARQFRGRCVTGSAATGGRSLWFY